MAATDAVAGGADLVATVRLDGADMCEDLARRGPRQEDEGCRGGGLISGDDLIMAAVTRDHDGDNDAVEED